MFRIIIHIILVLALAVLTGGILFFGAGVASVVFQPDLLPSRTLAGAVNAAMLHRLNVLEGVCAAIIPLALGYLAFVSPREASRIAFGLSIAVLFVVLYTGLKLFPDANALRLEIGDFDHVLAMKQGLLDRFHDLHTTYSRLIQGVLIAGLVILISHVVILARRRSEAAKPGSGESEKKGAGESEKGGAGESKKRTVSESGKRGSEETVIKPNATDSQLTTHSS